MHRYELKGRKLVVKEDFDTERDRFGKIVRGSGNRDRDRDRDRDYNRGGNDRGNSMGGGGGGGGGEPRGYGCWNWSGWLSCRRTAS